MKTLKFISSLKASALLFLTIAMFSQNASAIGVCSTVSTNSGVSVPVGQSPRQILLGDLNGDNAQDAVVITGGFSSSSAVSVLINSGTGTLSPFTTVGVNFSIGAVGLGDFNLDGALDLAVAASSSSSGSNTPLSIYPGNGNGSFGAPITINFQGSASALSIGDFNNDGMPDIVVATTGNNNIGALSLFLNRGFNSFTFAGNFPLSGSPRDLRIADFNGDGNLDVVASSFNGTASVVYGNGAGGFQTAINFNLFTGSFSNSGISLAVGDVNNDGRPDIAAVNGDSNSFNVLINNGNGTFAAPITNTFADFNLRPRSIVIGQFTGDGNTDIAVGVSSSFSDGVSAAVIVPGTGSGTFNVGSLTVAATGLTPSAIVSGDLNGDGRNDLITANAGSSDISVLLNNGADRYGANTFATGNSPSQVVVADFNGDGNLDTAVSNTQSSSGSNNTNGVVVYYGNGAGIVTNPIGLGSTPTQSLLADDVNNDGKVDLIVITSNQMIVYINSGTGLGNPGISVVNLNFTPRTLVSGDFNNDGKKDVVISAFNGNSIALLLGQGNGSFAAPTILASPANNPFLNAGDFNNDGKLDLALSGGGFSGTGGVFILLGTGTGTFSQVSENISVTSPGSVVSSDFNNDGKLDIAVVGSNNFSGGGSITVAFGDGDGTFSTPTVYATGLVPSFLTAGDFNNDRLTDLAYSIRSSNSVAVLLNTGRSSFRNGGSFLAGIFPEGIAAGDFNNDTRVDFVSVNRGGNNFSILTNNCREAVTKTDYTGEGKTDFSLFRPSNGTWYVRDSNGGLKNRQFGLEGDIPTPGDFDGDGTSDFAVFRPSDSTWYVVRSSNNLPFSVKWGTTGDIPVANDFDGDGRTDIAVFRPSNGVWYVIRSTNPNAFFAVQFGAVGDRPVAADYDGDGRADFAVFRPSNGVWYLLKSTEGFSAAQFGVSSDRTVPGDYDGDGKTDLGVYRNGVWFILLSKTNSLRVENFGVAADVPQPGDYDGDGKTDIAVYRPEGSNWFIIQSSDRAFRSVNFGNPNDIPVSSIYRY